MKSSDRVSASAADEHKPIVTVLHADGPTRIAAEPGQPLRDVLIAAELSPYTRLTERLNCGGRGLCATCGVRLVDPVDREADHWHDALADRFGYPRLSCQITVDRDMTVRLIEDKLVWGDRE